MMIATKIIGAENYPVLIAACLIYAVANACYWQLMPSMIYDVCEVEELISGEKRSGAVISLQALSESVSIAVGLVSYTHLDVYKRQDMLNVRLYMEGLTNIFDIPERCV